MNARHKRLDRQTLDVSYYDSLWSLPSTQADLILPPDEDLARQDLGHLLVHIWSRLGQFDGTRILELGCGSGDYTVMLARRGARVTAVDISMQAGRFTHARAEANGVGGQVQFCLANTETLAFASESFDLLAGFGVLHHLDLSTCAPEIRRVLKPGGRAIFREPMRGSWLLDFARNHIPYRKKARSPNEAPLTYEMIATVGAHFAQTHIREMYLCSMIGRALGSEASWGWLWRFDEWLMQRLPSLRRNCRYAVIEYCV